MSAPCCGTLKPQRSNRIGPLNHSASKPSSISIALHRASVSFHHPQSPIRIYLSAGIHATNLPGPLAALRLLRENHWPPSAELWFCPCLNPMGFVLNRRENPVGRDLNRDYRHLECTAEVRAHITWLERQPQFDLCLCLHRRLGSTWFLSLRTKPRRQASLGGNHHRSGSKGLSD